VDISVDASPGAAVTGVVHEIQNSAAGPFTIFPSPDTDPSNPQKVDQYVPVKIKFTNTGGALLAPGMNVTVHIHKS
jgi:multidrug resistance efflux pump